MAAVIPENQWHEIDEDIFANRKLPAIIQIREIAGCRLNEATDLLMARYATLRASTPERFDCSDQDYWGGCYSPPAAEK